MWHKVFLLRAKVNGSPVDSGGEAPGRVMVMDGKLVYKNAIMFV
jgi:hypothetical protein